MGFFDKLKAKFKSEFTYKINRDILDSYINKTIQEVPDMPMIDEFFIKRDMEDMNAIHVFIANYDVPCDGQLDCEKDLSGIIIWVNNKKSVDPETDEKFRLTRDFIDMKLVDFPEEFILVNELVGPKMLEQYEIK